MPSLEHQENPLDGKLNGEREGENKGELWRGLNASGELELMSSEQLREMLHREFPREASIWEDSLSRRHFLRIMGASLALAGASACTQMPAGRLIPYIQQPAEILPGTPLFFASSFLLNGVAQGVLARSNDGRPTKIEGNPGHPASRGATSIFMQASVLSLYDPDRSREPVHQGSPSSWDRFQAELAEKIRGWSATRGEGVALLTGPVTSPTLLHQLQEFLGRYPRARWHRYEPLHRDNAVRGVELAFGKRLEPSYHFQHAERVISLDSDFLFEEPASIRYAGEFMSGRRVREGHPGLATMNRLYVIEPHPSLTGAMADHRIPLRSTEVGGVARALARALGLASGTSVGPIEAKVSRTHGERIRAMADELRHHRGKSLVLAGPRQDPVAHALSHALNLELGNIGKTVDFIASPSASPLSLSELTGRMRSGQVRDLLILGSEGSGVNPAYCAPGDLNFATALDRVPWKVRFGMYEDETSQLCQWHLPEAHELESWGDATAHDGTVSFIQPLIAPLYQGRTTTELMAMLNARPGASSYELLRSYWKTQRRMGEERWKRSLHDGWLAGSGSPRKNPTRLRWVASGIQEPLQSDAGKKEEGLEVCFRPDPSIWDGRFSNNGWLQELPKPLSKLVWENAVFMGAATARRLNLKTGDGVELRLNGRAVRGGTFILPGVADDSLTIHFGYGRWRAGRVGSQLGFSAYALQDSATPFVARGVTVHRLPTRFELVTTQHHHSMEGRRLIRHGTLAQFLRDPRSIVPAPIERPSLYPESPYPEEEKATPEAWAMVIDLTSCIGCNACVIGCQAENNIPIVGKSEVARRREMHWIRIDRYYEGDPSHPTTFFQPVPCMHCEKAPCELVCPTLATTHDHTGINQMVYNRCVGTRYCSNNCPYKVRRFNFFDYSHSKANMSGAPSVVLLRSNPEVTVRSRGVMEKCTYCIQRIQAGRIAAEKEERPIRDGEIRTACQAACPTDAIVFGNKKDRASRVATLRESALNYELLGELNTHPRTTYLGRLFNPAAASGERSAQDG